MTARAASVVGVVLDDRDEQDAARNPTDSCSVRAPASSHRGRARRRKRSCWATPTPRTAPAAAKTLEEPSLLNIASRAIQGRHPRRRRRHHGSARGRTNRSWRHRQSAEPADENRRRDADAAMRKETVFDDESASTAPLLRLDDGDLRAAEQPAEAAQARTRLLVSRCQRLIGTVYEDRPPQLSMIRRREYGREATPRARDALVLGQLEQFCCDGERPFAASTKRREPRRRVRQ